MSRFVPLQVLEVRPETPDAFTIRFVKPSSGFSYKPGQYLTVRAIVNGKDERRAFSFSSCPTQDDFLSVTIKAIPNGVVSGHLRRTLKPGDSVDVLPPMGNFWADINAANPRHHVLIGGGSGITPLMSILRTVLQAEPASHVSLLYGNNNAAGIIFKAELDALEAQHPQHLKVLHTLSAPAGAWPGSRGRLAGTVLEDLLKQVLPLGAGLETVYYMCGPDGLMASAQDILAARGVAASNIKREWYGAPLDATPATVESKKGVASGKELDEYAVVTQTVRVRLDGQEYTITVPPTQYILHAALDAGTTPPTLARKACAARAAPSYTAAWWRSTNAKGCRTAN
jgi:ring-1,2-phenylacetyl-CoA epoxidase subunit PaaE